MEREIKILIVEHEASDIDLLKRELVKSFKNHSAMVVQTEVDFARELVDFAPHIVLSDFSLPQFDGISAFVVKQRICPDVPFILVSGTIGEENAVDLIKRGVTDYAIKDKLYTLAPKILRALNEAAEKEEKRKMNEALEASEASLRVLNTELEQRVQARTAELTEANSALEAFSYSVSHDLRSPVRSVMGFAQIINKEHGHALQGDLRELFTHIEKSSKRMIAIIDDLLALAKSGKDPLRITEVDMHQLFSNVWDSICFNTPHNAVIGIEHLPVVQADASMLEQVVVNLLSNAVKYSSKKEEPQIQVGCMETTEAFTFYVRDNGAGFDMQNYNRLFGAFQRLHGLNEFEGTGVGLMLIRKIVERHQGKVWAEGVVDEGATFYFSLPKK